VCGGDLYTLINARLACRDGFDSLIHHQLVYNSPMTSYEQYREYMAVYSDETAVMSMTVWKHPAFQAMLNMNTEVIPHLIYDLHDYYHNVGEDSSTLGVFDPWAAMALLGTIVQEQCPHFPEEVRGRLDPLCKIWIEWGKQHGYIFSPTVS